MTTVVLSACAAVSGLDGLSVGPLDGDGGDGAIAGDGSQVTDAPTGTDGNVGDGATNDDGGADTSSPPDTGTKDAAKDATADAADSGGDPGIRCGNGAFCTGIDVCCLEQSQASCTTPVGCGGAVLVNCDDRHECPGVKYCCAQWAGGPNNSTSCEDLCGGALTLCDPSDPTSCPNGHACTQTITTRGVAYTYCN